MLFENIRAVVFDAVGTLIHPNPPAPAVYAQTARRWGSRYDVESIKARFLEAFEHEELTDRRLGWRTSEAREIERWRHIVAKVLDDVSDPESCFHALFDHFSRPEAWICDPAIGDVLRGLAERGFVLGTASNYDSRLHRVIAGKPELRPIRHVIISSEVGWRKPVTEFFDAVCRTVGLPADQIVFVGDALINDVQGAEGAGLRAVWFNPSDPQDAIGRICISDLAELGK